MTHIYHLISMIPLHEQQEGERGLQHERGVMMLRLKIEHVIGGH